MKLENGNGRWSTKFTKTKTKNNNKWKLYKHILKCTKNEYFFLNEKIAKTTKIKIKLKLKTEMEIT